MNHSLRRAPNAIPISEPVSDGQQFHHWMDCIRGRVGSTLGKGVRWHDVREAVGRENIRAWYDAGMSPKAAADLVVDDWRGTQASRRPNVQA